MLTILFEAFTWPFWIFLFIMIGLGMASVENEVGPLATLVLLVTVVFLELFTNADPMGWLFRHLGFAVLIVVAYFIVGAAWSVVRWTLFCHDKAEYSRERRKNYPQWVVEIPMPLENKSLILLWIVYWPLSALWTAIHDPVTRISRWIYNKLVDTYTGISNLVFAGLKAESDAANKPKV